MHNDNSPSITTDAFVLTAESRTDNGRSFVVLYCTSPVGPLKVIVPYQPYFFVEDRLDLTEAWRTNLTDEVFTALEGLGARKLVFDTVSAADDCREQLNQRGIRILRIGYSFTRSFSDG